jgi:hypothetical protein
MSQQRKIVKARRAPSSSAPASSVTVDDAVIVDEEHFVSAIRILTAATANPEDDKVRYEEAKERLQAMAKKNPAVLVIALNVVREYAAEAEVRRGAMSFVNMEVERLFLKLPAESQHAVRVNLLTLMRNEYDSNISPHLCTTLSLVVGVLLGRWSELFDFIVEFSEEETPRQRMLAALLVASVSLKYRRCSREILFLVIQFILSVV